MTASHARNAFVPVLITAAIIIMMISSVIQSSADPLPPVLTRHTVLRAMDAGLSTDALAASGVTPSQLPAVLQAVHNTQNSLLVYTTRKQEWKAAHTHHHAVVSDIRHHGLSSDLDALRVQSQQTLSSATLNLQISLSTWITAFTAQLSENLPEPVIASLANTIANTDHKIPVQFRVLDPLSTPWSTLEAAWIESQVVAAEHLPDELRLPWLAAVNDPHVTAASNNHAANGTAIRTAFVQLVQQLPEH